MTSEYLNAKSEEDMQKDLAVLRDIFSVDLVRKRYADIGFEPCRGMYGHPMMGNFCCIIGAYCRVAGLKDERGLTPGNPYTAIGEHAGIDSGLVRALEAGWENENPDRLLFFGPRLEAFTLGRELAEAIHPPVRRESPPDDGRDEEPPRQDSERTRAENRAALVRAVPEERVPVHVRRAPPPPEDDEFADVDNDADDALFGDD